MNPCRNCDIPTDHPWEVCPKCLRDPATNSCEECGQYLTAHTELHNGATDVYVGHVHYWAVPAASSVA